MRNWTSLGISLALMMALACPLAAQSVNLIQNPSFETLSGGNIANWSGFTSSDRDNTTAVSGTYSLRLVGSRSGYSYQAPSFTAGNQYTMRCWTKTSAGFSGTWGLRWCKLNGTSVIITSRNVKYTETAGEWQLQEKTFVIPSDTTSHRLDINYNVPAGQTAWMDDVSFNPVNSYGSLARFYVKARSTRLTTNNKGFAVISAVLADDAGNPVQNASQTVTFTETGPGSLIGNTTVSPVNGVATILYKSGTTTGTSTVTASTSGYSNKSVTLTTVKNPIGDDDYFGFGVFEDGNIINWATMRPDIVNHNMNSVMVGNSGTNQTSILTDADSNGVGMFMAPTRDLWNANPPYWDASVPCTLQSALNYATPIVNSWGGHSSLRGYYLYDEPSTGQSDTYYDKISYLRQAFNQLDTDDLTFVVLANGDGTPAMFDRIGMPDAMCTDPYPFHGNPPIGSWVADWIENIRYYWHQVPASYPIITILQSHGTYANQDPRYPNGPETAAQFWIALGEGSNTIHYFIYGTQQWWVGIEDNSAIYNELSSIGSRIASFRTTLGTLQKGGDKFTVSGSGIPYISTLVSADGGTYYVVICNGDCSNTRSLTVSSPVLTGQIRDLETSTNYNLGSSFSLTAGNGKIFQFIPGDTTAPTTPTNLAVTGTTTSTISLSWTGSSDNVGVTGYDVYENGAYLASTASTSYTATGLAAGTSYSFRVSAYDAAGNDSALSTEVVGTTQGGGGTNLLLNAGLETDASPVDNWPDNWQPRTANGTRVTDIKHSGSAALRVSAHAGQYSFQNCNLTPNTAYTFSGWVKTSGISGSGINLRYAQLTPSSQTWSSSWTTGTQDWVQVAATFTAPSNHLTGRADMQWAFTAGSGWFDDLSLTAPATNLLTNPGMETDSAAPIGWPDNWQDRTQGARDTSVKRSGAASLRVTAATGQYSFQNYALVQSASYTLSGWCKTSGVSGTGIALRYAQTAPSGTTWETSWQSGTIDWTQRSVTFTAPSNHTAGRVDMEWTFTAGSGYFDDLNLVRN